MFKIKVFIISILMMFVVTVGLFANDSVEKKDNIKDFAAENIIRYMETVNNLEGDFPAEDINGQTESVNNSEGDVSADDSEGQENFIENSLVGKPEEYGVDHIGSMNNLEGDLSADVSEEHENAIENPAEDAPVDYFFGKIGKIGEWFKKRKNNNSNSQTKMPEEAAEKIKKIDEELRVIETKLTKDRIKAEELEKEIILMEKAFHRDRKEKLEIEFNELKRNIEETYNKYAKRMEDKAKIYEKLESTGDPVNVSTGRFIAKYSDYKAKDFLEEFTIKRYLSYDNCNESFGNNWICSLDSRIIRCNYENYEEYIKIYENILETIENIKNLYLSYDSYNSEIENIYKSVLQKESKYKKLLNFLKERERIRNEINEKNKFVNYGTFSNLDNYLGNENLLIYKTEYGQQIVFLYKENGVWETDCGSDKKILQIRNLKPDGSYSSTQDCQGGYKIIYEDGSCKLFSQYGILEKYIDRNNNETVYKNENGRVYEIKLKTGEILKIKRNEKNYITAIEGNVSGASYYFYSGDNLSKVIDNQNIEVGFGYDSNGDLILIEKNNNSKIKIDYEYNSILEHTVCVAVTNQNNDVEEFHLDPEDKVMKHNYYGYGNEIYKFNDLGQTIYYSDLNKNVMETEYDSLGHILSITKNGIKKVFGYDENFHTTSISYEDGSQDLTFYNNLGLVCKVIDRDGNSNSYEYDKHGNLIKTYLGNTVCGEYWYYPNGLLKGFLENDNKVEFKYNRFGSVIEKKENKSDGKLIISEWEYDNKNNLVEARVNKKLIKRIEYADKKEIITSDDRKVTNFFNNRGLLVKQIDEDILIGEKHVKENVYDNSDNIVKVIVDNNLLSEYEYYKNGILKSYTVWNSPSAENKENLLYGIKFIYQYDDRWRKSAEIRAKIKNNEEIERVTAATYSYSQNLGNTVISEHKYLEKDKKSTFNKYGKLIKEEWEDGYCKTYAYSKAGKLLLVKDNSDNIYKYIYNSNGSFKILYENFYGGNIIYEYNKNGDLVSFKDYYGFIYRYGYDSSRNIIFEKTPNSVSKIQYDDRNRVIYKCIADNKGSIISEESIIFDDKLNTKSVKTDGYLNSIKKLNTWGMIIESQGIAGHFYYSYDYLGNCRKVTDYYGNIILYEYSPDGKILQEKYADGALKNYTYNLFGIVKTVSNNGTENCEVSVENNCFMTRKNGRSEKIEKNIEGFDEVFTFYDIGKYYKKSFGDNSYSIADEEGNTYIYNTDKTGQIIEEVNPLGRSSKFTYSDDLSLSKKINYSGIVEKYNFDQENNAATIEYSTGEKVVFGFNALGLITRLGTNDYSLLFEYDKRGNLISEYSEKTGSRIDYFYDSFSRCVKKSGDTFSFIYDYDEMGSLVKMEDEKSGNWVCFEYDNLYRVKNKKYSNGMETKYGYNKNGLLEYYVTKNNIGLFMVGDFLLYDNFGRIILKSDIRGNLTKYKYDERSRLIATEYPYTEDKCNSYLEEMTECGYYNMGKEPDIKRIKLEKNEILGLQQSFEKAGVKSFLPINLEQRVLTENYNYSKNGSIKSVINPYGEIEYCYDSLNRLISKNYKSTNCNGIKLRWNDDNCLEEILSSKRKMSFYYNALKRPTKVINENLTNSKVDVMEYSYDALGRRIIEKCNNYILENIYDGLSVNLLSKKNITGNDFISSVFNDRKLSNSSDEYKFNSTDFNSSSDYRFVDNNDYTPFGEIKRNDTDKTKTNKYLEVNEYVDKNISTSFNIISFGNTPEIISYIDGSQHNNLQVKFVINDYKNMQIGTVNVNSDFVELSTYDTWGCCNLGKSKYNIINNLGYRDYIPLLKTFTTEDPVRDGRNWFAYCPCDAVNYVDKKGFAKQSLSNSENCRYQAKMVEYIMFYDREYHDSDFRSELNCYKNIYYNNDCTDTAMAMANNTMRCLNLLENDKYMKEFSKAINQQNMDKARSIAFSGDIISGRMGRKVCNGCDNELIKRTREERYGMSPDNPDYIRECNNQKKLIEMLKDPNTLQPGTVIVWMDSEYNREDKEGFPSSCGHVITVVSREFDENGNVIGFLALEGHTGGQQTKLNYFTNQTYINSINEYWGAVSGIYELEDPNAPIKNNKCVL